jgi:SET domain-containing protein
MEFPKLYILETAERGRGVFSSVHFEIEDVIEICPVIICPPSDYDKIHHSSLHDYYFLWGEKYDHLAFALGFGSLYNHSKKPNAAVTMDLERKTIDFICIKPIQPGDEIFFDYHDHDLIKEDLWFETK